MERANGVVARQDSPRGEVVLRRRARGDGVADTGAGGGADGEVLELRVNGVFVMDTLHTRSEELLAERSLAGLQRPVRALVGGLGLGSTLQTLLADDRVTSVVVAEIEPAVVDWVRTGLVPSARDLLDDPRVRVEVADVAVVVAATAARAFDLVLLDVDNGPAQLVHEHNAGLYAPPFLAQVARVLRSGGRLAVWSAERSPEVLAGSRVDYADVAAERVPVRLQGRDSEFWLLRATAR
jgi:spermidine synthase